MHRQYNIDRGEGKHFWDADCHSIPGNGEICAHFCVLSTSFVQGCMKHTFVCFLLYSNMIPCCREARFASKTYISGAARKKNRCFDSTIMFPCLATI